MRVLLSNSNLCYALFIPETVNISGPSRNDGPRHQRHHGWSRVRILHRLPIIFGSFLQHTRVKLSTSNWGIVYVF